MKNIEKKQTLNVAVSFNNTDLPKGQARCVASGWQATKTILSASVFAGEILSRP